MAKIIFRRTEEEAWNYGSKPNSEEDAIADLVLDDNENYLTMIE